MIYEYFNFLIFLFVNMTITFFLVFLSDIFAEPVYDMEKNSAYECGFQPFDIQFQNFDVKFYLIALLFLIFDVEVIFIVPFINIMKDLSFNCIFFFIFFYFMFFLGLLYEWKKNYLDWE